MSIKINSLSYVASQSLLAASYDEVPVLSCINSDMGNLKLVDSESTLGKPKTTKETKNKASVFKLSISTGEKFETSPTIGLRFYEWSELIRDLNKKYSVPNGIYPIPQYFVEWLDKFAKKEEKKEEKKD